MPRRGRHQLSDQRVFFVTSTAKENRHYFESMRMRLRLLSIVEEACQRFNATLYGYVIMSNHIHLLVRVEQGGPQLSKLLHNIKSVSSHLLYPGSGGIWQQRFDDVAIYSSDQFRIKLNYIHNNPVKAGMVADTCHYPFSSAADWQGGKGQIKVCTEIW